MRTTTKKGFLDLTKKQKQNILDWIVETDSSVRTTTEHFNLTSGCIDKIFEERFKPPKWTDDYKTINSDPDCILKNND
tara:strand:- start:520 stop:753 length:234 start_codon:yes stop_codon:yes gene_type:complete